MVKRDVETTWSWGHSHVENVSNCVYPFHLFLSGNLENVLTISYSYATMFRIMFCPSSNFHSNFGLAFVPFAFILFISPLSFALRAH